MSEFQGFPQGKIRQVPVPGIFFQEILPRLDNLAEIKVILHIFWRLANKEGSFNYVSLDELLQDKEFLSGLGGDAQVSEAALKAGLERAIQRKVILHAVPASNEEVYFLNTPKGRAAVKAIAQGEWRYATDGEEHLEILPEPANVFRLYEENIGPLTPLIADTLKDAELTYPLDWIEAAIRLAVETNKRNWRFVAAVLRKWKEEGKFERKGRQDTEKARRRYAEWESPGKPGR